MHKFSKFAQITSSILLTGFCAIFSTINVFAQCNGNNPCSCNPGYTYTTGSIDYANAKVVSTGITSGAYSSCGHTYAVEVRITSPDNRLSTYSSGYSYGGYASGSNWIDFNGFDGTYNLLTLHREYCYILGAAFVAAVTTSTQNVAPTVKFVSLNWVPNRIGRSDVNPPNTRDSFLTAVITATSSVVAANVQIEWEALEASRSGTIKDTVLKDPNNDPVTGNKTLTSTNTIQAIKLTDSAVTDDKNSDGTIQYTFFYSGPSTIGVTPNVKTIRYEGGASKEATLTVKSIN
jgi:hypothetical protein